MFATAAQWTSNIDHSPQCNRHQVKCETWTPAPRNISASSGEVRRRWTCSWVNTSVWSLSPRHFDDETLIAKFWRDTEEVKDECPQAWLLVLRRARGGWTPTRWGCRTGGGRWRPRASCSTSGGAPGTPGEAWWAPTLACLLFVFLIGAFNYCPTLHLLFTE